MNDISDHPLDAFLATISSTHRPWVLPLLRGLDDLGGSAAPMETENRIRELVGEQVNPRQWAYLLKNAHIRWARFGLKEAGMVGGPKGTWVLTDRGRELLEQSRDRPIEIPELPELDEETYGDIDAPTRTVPATAYEAYKIPTLELLSDTPLKKQELYEQLQAKLGDDLLPGDHGIMRRGRKVWMYRVSWALTYLKRDGLARNSAAGWEITASGRSYLESERPSWKLAAFQTSKAEVREGTGRSRDTEPPEPDPDETSSAWTLEMWEDARAKLGGAVYNAMHARLRPDLGGTPTRGGSLLRNVILFGPPGTGKTHLARLAAQALTGQDEPGPESRWRVVQFHPSYAYEDFIQGLRPDLEEEKLRYKLHQGPFQQICDAATDDPDHFHVLVIDEINRGDPARIFGELLYALEYRGAAVDLPTGGQLVVPPNLVVIGTMNSVDRSVALVDYALRRRFGFIRVDPDPEVVRKIHKNKALAGIAVEVLTSLNQWLSEQLDADHQIGQPAISGLSRSRHAMRDHTPVFIGRHSRDALHQTRA